MKDIIIYPSSPDSMVKSIIIYNGFIMADHRIVKLDINHPSLGLHPISSENVKKIKQALAGKPKSLTLVNDKEYRIIDDRGNVTHTLPLKTTPRANQTLFKNKIHMTALEMFIVNYYQHTGALDDMLLNCAKNLLKVSYSMDFAAKLKDIDELKPLIKELALKSIKTNRAERALEYCEKIEHDADMRQEILDSNNAMIALNYCDKFGDDADMRQIVVNSNDAGLAFWYCRNIKPYQELKNIILDQKSSRYAYWYCSDVENDTDMRQLVLNANNAELAFLYCEAVSNDADMRQVIIDAKDKKLAELYCKFVSDDEDMKEVYEH